MIRDTDVSKKYVHIIYYYVVWVIIQWLFWTIRNKIKQGNIWGEAILIQIGPIKKESTTNVSPGTFQNF